MTVPVAVFASGGGTNLQALIDRLHGEGDVAAAIRLVVSDRPGAGALARARRAGVSGRVVPVRGRDPEEVAEETLALLEEAGIGIVALAGYLRLIPERVVRRFDGRMLNVHPALLPAFGGPGMYGERVHRAVLDSGCRVSGATVHFVDEHYDRGTILAQWPVPVLPGDTVGDLARRVLSVEHRLFPAAVEQLARRIGGRPPAAGALSSACFFDLARGDGPDPRRVGELLSVWMGESQGS